MLNDTDQPLVHKKKNRNVTLISLQIIIFASIGSAVALLVQRYKPVSPVAEASQAVSERNKDSIPELPVPDIVEENNTPEVIIDDKQSEENSSISVVQNSEEQTKPQIKLEVVEQKPAAEPSVTVLPERSQEEINVEYLSLINSGKEKMTASDFSGAKADLTEASEIKMTQELFDLIGDCKLKENEQLLAERKAKYEEKMPFGSYTIVRKKSNSNYGAVDADAFERIPCKYKNVGKAENGRAFERADGLFDIYNTEGMLISEDSPYYY